jgi:CO/xanthine dehydrogenase Mo-binding subunit
MGSKRIGIVGTAAGASNAVHHVTGLRVRDLLIPLERAAGRTAG